MFTGDAFNGLINCYKEFLDLVKRKKIPVKSLCTMNLLQLMVISMCEGENEQGLPRWVPRGCLGREAAGIGDEQQCLCSQPTPRAACWAAHPQLPIPAEQSHGDGSAWNTPARQRGEPCYDPEGMLLLLGYINRGSWLPQCLRKKCFGQK